MKNQSKIRLVALAMAVCASLTACGNTADDDMAIVQYTEGKQQEQTTRYNSIYDSMDDYPQNEEQQVVTEAVAETVMVSKFTKASDFNEGYAIVTYGGKYYIIDTTGNIVLEFTDTPKEYTIYNGGFIILENENVMNLKGEIVADTAVHGHDMVRGIWHEYIVLRKKVETLERTGFDYCILNSDGSVHVEWAKNPYYPFDGKNPKDWTNVEITQLQNNYIKIEGKRYGYEDNKAIYNLKTGEYNGSFSWNAGKEGWEYDINNHLGVDYYDYGYVVTDKANGKTALNIQIFDYTDNLIEKFTVDFPNYDPLLYAFENDIIWSVQGYDVVNSFYDFMKMKNINLPYNTDNLQKVELYRCGNENSLYLLKIQNKEFSEFYAVADENGNYIVEPIKEEISNCNEGVYTTSSKMCKTDGTVIAEGGEFGQFTDGYCCMNENSYIDINGNKLEVEFKNE